MKEQKTVRLRFAPSPTGYVHIGSLRTALYNYLYAQQQGGQYIVRVEDTDQTRLVEGAVESMIQSTAWAGVFHDEGPVLTPDGSLEERGAYGPYVQSQRLPVYKKYVDQLIEKGVAYPCFCSKERLESVREAQKSAGETPKYDGHCRCIDPEEAAARRAAGEPHVIRLKLPENHVIAFEDLIKGPVQVNTDDLDDQVLVKTDGFPTYHLAVVVDDHLMGITHVVRGDEWLISTPKHIFMYEAFGWTPPQFVHLPVILGKNKKKLSKRQGDVAVEDFKNKGYLPEALINYVALVGWSPDDGAELMSMDEMIRQFSFERVSKSGGIFDVDKLNWMNNQYMRSYDLDALTQLSMPYFIKAGFVDSEAAFESAFDHFKQIVDVLRERLNTLEEVAGYKAFFNRRDVVFEDDAAAEVMQADHVPELVGTLIQRISQMPQVTSVAIKGMLKDIQKEMGIKGKALFMPARVAITGQMHGPDIAAVAEILGKERTLERLQSTLSQIGA